MRASLFLPLLVALGGALAPRAAAQAEAPLALVVEAEAAVWPDRSDSTGVAPLDAATAGEAFATGAEGRLTLHFADGLRASLAASAAGRLAGAYADGAYAERGLVLDSGLVRYTFEQDENAPIAFGMTGYAAVATVATGTGGAVADADGLRLIVVDGVAELSDSTSGQRLSVAAGEVAVANADGLSVRPSTLAERDLVAEPTARRRRLLVPGTDDEGNARTFIIEWDEQ